MNLQLSNLERHVQNWYECTRCEIGETATKHVIFKGDVPCQILFVGEGPGETEDLEGFPFVGRSGKLLDSWIEQAQKEFFATRARFFTFAVTNVVCCRPVTFLGKNRPPSSLEVSNCAPRLQEFLSLAEPKGIVTLGKVAQMNVDWPLNLRVDLYHPSYILRYRPELGPSQAQLLSDFVKRIL